MIELRWSGTRELAAVLRQMPAMIAQELLERAVLAASDLIAIAAQGRIPRPGLRRRPGTRRLAESIRVELQSKDRAHARVVVGTKAPYGHLIEYGHQIVARGPSRKGLQGTEDVLKAYRKAGVRDNRTLEGAIKKMRADLRSQLKLRRSKGSIGFVAPRPFLRPAFDEQRARAMQRMADVIGIGVRSWVAQRMPVRQAA